MTAATLEDVRMIASDWHSGQSSAFYALASSGYVDSSALIREATRTGREISATDYAEFGDGLDRLRNLREIATVRTFARAYPFTVEGHTHVWGRISGSVGHCLFAGCDKRNAYYEETDGLKCDACGQFVGYEVSSDGTETWRDASGSAVCAKGGEHWATVQYEEESEDDD